MEQVAAMMILKTAKMTIACNTHTHADEHTLLTLTLKGKRDHLS